MTVVIALILLPLLPDYPLQSKHMFVSRELQLIAEWRVRKENAGIADEDHESVWWGLREAVRDPKLYMFVVTQMALITAESFNNFFPSIVGTLGYDSTTTLLLTSPPYFFAFFASLAVSFHASRKHERGYHIAIPMMFALVGNLLVSSTFSSSHHPRVSQSVGSSNSPHPVRRPCSSPPTAGGTSPCSS
jgi:hypothetical protein